MNPVELKQDTPGHSAYLHMLKMALSKSSSSEIK